MNHEASHSHRFTHVVTLRCDATSPPSLTSFTISLFPRSPPLSVLEHLRSDALLPSPPSALPCTPTTALTAVSCQRGQILTCSVGRLLPGLAPHFPPSLPPSLNADYVQQSSLLSNQRTPQKSHSLVMTLLFSEHVGFGWLYLLPVESPA